MQFVTDAKVLKYQDKVWKYLTPEQGTGGPFSLRMNFVACNCHGLTQLRLGLARPWEFDQEKMEDEDNLWQKDA